MIEAHEYSMAQLEEILSALDGQKRNPCSKKAAIKAINKKATEMGLAAEDVFATVDLLLSGVMTHEEWRASLLRDEAAAEAEVQAEAEERIETEEPAEPETEEPVAAAPIDLHSDEYAETDFAKENEASWAKVGKKISNPRENSKQARVIEMLRRPEGATVIQISEEMGWQRHTTRAFVSATIGKKLGLNVTSGKIDGQRVYRIED